MEIQNAIERVVHAINKADLLLAKKIAFKALKQDSRNSDILHLIGLVYYKKGQLKKAIQFIKKAIHLNKHDARFYKDLGGIFLEIKDYDNSIKYYSKGVENTLFSAELYNDLGLALLASNKKDKAIDILSEALVKDPDNENVLINLGNLYHEDDDLTRAACYFNRALQVNNNAVTHNNIGNVYSRLKERSKAINHYKNAIAIAPEFKNPYNGIGKIYFELRQYDDAINFFKKAISIDEECRIAHRNLSYTFLSIGNFSDGWSEYEWREVSDKISKTNLWSGQPLDGKSILIHAEQGVGDEIMFASCLVDLVKRNPRKIVLECDSRLNDVFLRSFPQIKTISRKVNSVKCDNYDYHSAIGSLPNFFRKQKKDFLGCSYLKPSKNIVEKWLTRYKKLGDGLKVGISWNSSKSKSFLSQERSIDLGLWEPILKTNDVKFINLQYGDCSQDMQKIKQDLGVKIYDWEDSNPLVDLDDFFAKIYALDLVISIDNSTVHISGSIGTPTLALIPFAPDWRWEFDAQWYASVSLIKQEREGSWDFVVRSASQLLANKIKDGCN